MTKNNGTINRAHKIKRQEKAQRMQAVTMLRGMFLGCLDELQSHAIGTRMFDTHLVNALLNQENRLRILEAQIFNLSIPQDPVIVEKDVVGQ